MPDAQGLLRGVWRIARTASFVALGTALAILGWWAVVTWSDVSPLTLPPPDAVWQAATDNSDTLRRNAVTTAVGSLAAFSISAVAGTLIALLLSRSARVRRLLFPAIIALQAAPKIALAPLLVVWLGFGREMAIVIGIIVAIFPMIINATTGLTTVDSDVVMMARTMRASKNQIFLRIELPYALPHLFSGMKNCLVLAVVGVVLGELTGANSGLGYVLLSQSGQFQTAYAFAAMLLLMLEGLVLFYVLEALEKRFAWYAHDARRAAAAAADDTPRRKTLEAVA